MPFQLFFQPEAVRVLESLRIRDSKKYRKVAKCLALLEADPKYPGLNSHRFDSLDVVHGQKIWESYVENRTPGAYRVFWHYGPDDGEITIVSITPHP